MARVADRAGLAVLFAAGLLTGIAFAQSTFRPVDADMVWRTAQAESFYGLTWAADANSRYVYPPVLAQAVAVITPLGWQFFVVVWQVVVFTALWVALRAWAIPVMSVSVVSAWLGGLDSPMANPLTLVLVGNIQSLVAASIVVGLRYPAAWAFVVLTKIGPGIGLLWFATRREWRNLAIAAGTTGVVAMASLVLGPSHWHDFVSFAVANAGTPSPNPVVPVPLFVRVPIVAALIIFAAKTDRAWIVPLAAAFASLALYQWSWLTLAAASLPLAFPIHEGGGHPSLAKDY